MKTWLISIRVFLSNLVCIYLFLVTLYIHTTNAVKGCILFTDVKSFHSLQALCDRINYNYTVIPQSLPAKVVNLTVNHQLISRLDSSQFSHLPNLTSLNLDGNGLRSIANGTFKSVPKIRRISLKYNQIRLVPESFYPAYLAGLKHLEYLDLRHNPLGYVPDNYFSAFGNSLKSLLLSSTVSDFYITPKGFDGLFNIEVLDLSYSKLTSLPQEIEYSLRQMPLRELYIHRNKWTCDCKIRWLRVWFDKYGESINYLEGSADKVYSESSKMINREDPLRQPVCYSPPKLANKLLLGNYKTSIRLNDLRCTSQIYTKNINVVADYGSKITLMCKCFSDPATKIKWFKDDVLVQDHWPRISRNQTEGKSFTAFLSIKPATNADEAKWQCVLDDGFEKKSTTYNVIITKKESGISGLYYWIGGLNTGLVLKYTGLAGACLVLLLMLIGLIVYCFYGKSPNKQRRTQYHVNDANQKPSEYNSITRNENSNYNFSSLSQQSIEKNQHFVDSHGFPRDRDGKIPSPILQQQSNTTTGVMNMCPLISNVDDHNLLLNPDMEQKVDDYVAFRVVSPCNQNVEEFPLHQLTFVSADGTLFIDNQQGSSSTCTNPTSCTNTATMNTTSTSTAGPSELTEPKPNDTDMNNQESYSPCPLHGHLLSTLRKHNKTDHEHSLKPYSTLNSSSNPVGVSSNDTENVQNSTNFETKSSYRTNDDEGYSTSV